jgi:hypothetical protein
VKDAKKRQAMEKMLMQLDEQLESLDSHY